ncbi:hypothetical protein ELQ35_17185 [Peribacillus cavernae]|uniref:Uncharacterized protein n=1 Tax=Peribacillus cavernae TaxID=1674310 RepID=A0A3S0VFS5_9BACI|nr:hypothetical protein [Peribacillus cavernae]MDQ0219494.1 hypothetical protein [Peribacillus cavernae]RUQ27089.1 hypothetical protein ELQ35_17185 [Peribacillus cavernae]
MIEKVYLKFQIPISNAFVLNKFAASKFAAETGESKSVISQLITRVNTKSSGLRPMTSGDNVVSNIEMGSIWCIKMDAITHVKIMMNTVNTRDSLLMYLK